MPFECCFIQFDTQSNKIVKLYTIFVRLHKPYKCYENYALKLLFLEWTNIMKSALKKL